MITILRGTSRDLIPYVTREYPTPNDFIIIGSKAIALPFLLVRLVIPMFRKQLGNEVVEDKLQAYKAHFGLIFNGLAAKLTVEEQQEQVLLGARLSSNITHSRVAKDALLKAYARVLMDLKALHNFKLVIPDMTHIDTGSLDLLLYLYQIFPEKSPDLVIGYDPAWEKPVLDRATGISWYYALDSDTALRSFVYAFEAVAIEKRDIGETGNMADSNHSATVWDALGQRLDVLDDKLELYMHTMIGAPSLRLDEESKASVLKCIQRCFRLYDFTHTLLLGIRSLAALEPLLCDSERAALYHMIGLSAHNRHFFSQGNMVLADFINDNLERALLCETDAATRVAILYRLMVTQGRRKNDPERTHRYLDEAHSILSEKDFQYKALLAAWINNIHSFLLMKQGKIKEAITLHEESFYLLARQPAAGQPVIQQEIEFTRAVLAENLSTLNALLGDVKQMKMWYTMESRLAKQWPGLYAVPSGEWQSFYYQNLELHKALEKTQQGLEKARNSFHYVLEYFFVLSAADIHYRLGNAEEALAYFQKALLFQEQIGYEYASIHALRSSIVKIKLRLGSVAEALADAAAMGHAAGNDAVMEHIDICLLSATGYSLSGAVEKAEEQVNQAIDLAVASGDCGAMVKVMLSAGVILQQLNHKQDAMAAYQQALDISGTILDGLAYQAEPAEIAEIYLGLFECSAQHIDYLDLAIRNLSPALKNNADSWWDLPRVLSAFSKLAPRQRNRCLRKNKSAISTIKKAAKQRNDCQPYLSALKIISTQQLTIQ